MAKHVDDYLYRLNYVSDEYKNLAINKPLLGVPFTIKDSIFVKEIVCTAGIPSRKNKVSKFNAIVVERMLDAGAILLGITNVPEMLMALDTVNTIYGRTKNPYDLRKTTGGSSGGEAALIAAAGSVIGLGTDVGGSIRIPAAFNGIFGLKPTPGLIPLQGIYPMVKEGYPTKMCSIGPMCRYAKDLKILLKIFSADNCNLKQCKNLPSRKLRIVYMDNFDSPLIENSKPDVRKGFRKILTYFERKYNVRAQKLILPTINYAVSFWMASMEISESPPVSQMMADMEQEVNCLAELAKFFIGKSQHTIDAIVAGIFPISKISNSNVKHMRFLRDELRKTIIDAFGENGFLLFPCYPSTAPFKHQMKFKPLNSVHTSLWNTLALPALACPIGINDEGMPLAIQIVGPPMSDNMLIELACELEEEFGGWIPPNNLFSN
uniref:Amidase domain-containing protein n=1 Tax=Acrobeloides nanus TaxID=290746 RepID=A0A914EJ03_9BILA